MSEPIKVAFFDTKPYDVESFREAGLASGLDITFFSHRLTPDTVTSAQGFQAVCVFVNDVVDAAVIDGLERQGVRLVAIRAAGYNNVDLKAIWGRLHVAHVPAYSPYAVAEHAVALMLTLNRKVHRAYYRTRDNNFLLDGLLGFDMHQKTIGVIGTGRIGRACISLLKGFGMRVLAFDLRPDEAYAREVGIEYADLDTIYRSSDILTLHCPLTPETKHLINAEAIAKMKRGVMLINTSRGLLIDSKALVDGLKSRQIGFAGLDVYEEETDYFFEDFSTKVITDDVLARLLSFNNVLITAHQGFFTKEALGAIASETLANIKGFFDGSGMPHEICYQCGTPDCPRKISGKCF
jgi:D-lactate dehydrogenase